MTDTANRRKKTLPGQDYQQKGLPLHPSSSCLEKPKIGKRINDQ